MDAVLVSNLGNRLLSFDCFQSDFSFELGAVLFAFVLTHQYSYHGLGSLELSYLSSFGGHLIQLAHAGRKSSTSQPWAGGNVLSESQGGWTSIAPSAIPFEPDSSAPIALASKTFKR